MPSAIVLGAGLVGSVIASDLASDGDFDVTVGDASDAALKKAATRAHDSGAQIETVRADLSDADELTRVIAPHDVVVGALASRIGFRTLGTVIEAGKPYADISFMPENALELHDLAVERGVTCVVDCGVAPGMSNLLAAHSGSRMDSCERIEIMVGGLPRERRWPFQYKAGFSPADVIEEYTRPARYVEHGQVVIHEALSEPEMIDLPGVGTLEAFNTDGLRSLADTMTVPNMKEKTLRYPGHIELMRVFRETGLFGTDEIEVNGVRVRPLDVVSTLMFPMWSYEDGEADLTVMRIVVEGDADGRGVCDTWDLLDVMDPRTGWTSMSRTTAFPCAIVARMLARAEIDRPGVNPPELIAPDPRIVDHILAEHRARGVEYRFDLAVL